MAFPSYSTGTVSVPAGGTVVTGVGTLWSTANVKPGDDIVIAGQTVVVMDFTDATHMVINSWPGTTQSAVAYKLVQSSPLRYGASQTMMDVSQIVAAMNTDGYYFYVSASETVPNPSYGNEGQYAMQATTGKQWLKSGGVWVYIGITKGISPKGAYNPATTYIANDVVSHSTGAYLAVATSTGQALSNAAYWMLFAPKGDQGLTGPSYAATSGSSFTIGPGVVNLVTQLGLAYVSGSRVRVAYVLNTTNWVEGICGYNPANGNMSITVDAWNGSATLANWTLSIAGQFAPGVYGTSGSSFTISSGVKTITTQAGLAFNNSRVRVSYALNNTNWVEGICSTMPCPAI